MEMHTRESLRRVHGIEVPPFVVRAHTDQLTYSDYSMMAARLRNRAIAEAFAGAVKLVKGLAVRIGSFIGHKIRCRRDERLLMQMSEHLLKDIGIQRSQIAGAVRYGRDFTR